MTDDELIKRVDDLEAHARTIDLDLYEGKTNLIDRVEALENDKTVFHKVTGHIMKFMKIPKLKEDNPERPIQLKTKKIICESCEFLENPDPDICDIDLDIFPIGPGNKCSNYSKKVSKKYTAYDNTEYKTCPNCRGYGEIKYKPRNDPAETTEIRGCVYCKGEGRIKKLTLIDFFTEYIKIYEDKTNRNPNVYLAAWVSLAEKFHRIIKISLEALK